MSVRRCRVAGGAGEPRAGRGATAAGRRGRAGRRARDGAREGLPRTPGGRPAGRPAGFSSSSEGAEPSGAVGPRGSGALPVPQLPGSGARGVPAGDRAAAGASRRGARPRPDRTGPGRAYPRAHLGCCHRRGNFGRSCGTVARESPRPRVKFLGADTTRAPFPLCYRGLPSRASRFPPRAKNRLMTTRILLGVGGRGGCFPPPRRV